MNPHGRFTWYMTRKEAQRVERQFPDGFTARDHRVFGGVVETRGAPPLARLFYRLAGVRTGDHRDWPAIEAWAGHVAAALIAATAAAPGTAAGQYRPPEPPAGW